MFKSITSQKYIVCLHWQEQVASFSSHIAIDLEVYMNILARQK